MPVSPPMPLPPVWPPMESLPWFQSDWVSLEVSASPELPWFWS
jgi:hypothetical protein